ncbi:MAG: hypothetical protein BGO69_12690 [Bacteroidetes bacterium 46-16]|nr:MAG: hypothetical protein BGO69_12690 [Bacteroidetes bacterium 46-16]
MTFYKVVYPLSSEVTIDTAIVNYSQTLCDKDSHEPLLDLITRYSNELDLPLDFFFSINNNLALQGDAYLPTLPRSVDKQFELFAITQNENHRGYYIEERYLIAFVESLFEMEIEVFDEGNYLWEYICEMVRVAKHIDKPSREESFFLFGNPEDCQYFIDQNSVPGTTSIAQIVAVEIIEGGTPFKGDMNLWDLIPNNATFLQAANMIHDYWSGRTSDKPVYEYLFQGKCKLSPL